MQYFLYLIHVVLIRNCFSIAVKYVHAMLCKLELISKQTHKLQTSQFIHIKLFLKWEIMYLFFANNDR